MHELFKIGEQLVLKYSYMFMREQIHKYLCSGMHE